MSENKMIIKKANTYDSINIARLHYELWKQHYKNIVSDEFIKKVSLEKRKKQWIRYIQDNGIVYVLEEKTGDTAGFIVPVIHKKKNGEYVGEIIAHYIANSYNKKGYGKKLITTCVRFFLKNNINSMYIWIHRENKSLEFYKKLGAKEVDAKIEKVDTKNMVKLKLEWSDLRNTFGDLE